MRIKIFYHHTDSSGAVYHANYFSFFEDARTEFLESKGVNVKELGSRGIYFVVSRQELDCASPVFYGEEVDVLSWVSSASAARLNFDAEIKNREGVLLAKGKTVLVCVDGHFKPRVMPEDFRAKMVS